MRMPRPCLLYTSIDFSHASNDELYELINEATTEERFHEVVYAIVDRAGRGQLWPKSD